MKTKLMCVAAILVLFPFLFLRLFGGINSTASVLAVILMAIGLLLGTLSLVLWPVLDRRDVRARRRSRDGGSRKRRRR